MSAEEHTPGRLVHDTRGYPHADVRVQHGGRAIARTWNVCSNTPKNPEQAKQRTLTDRANARRIVACWNACIGLSTEALERLYTLDKANVGAHVDRDRAMRQRDELLAALRRATTALAFSANASPAMRDEYEAASAAIAKITGAST